MMALAVLLLLARCPEQKDLSLLDMLAEVAGYQILQSYVVYLQLALHFVHAQLKLQAGAELDYFENPAEYLPGV
jgi:hypothetical protein